METFGEFLTEGKDDKGGLTIFDIDDTLFKTTAKVNVVKGGKKVKELKTGEYNNYRLKKGESFDFSEFKDALKFQKESRPIKRMMAKAKAILQNAMRKPKSKVIVVTARNNMDNKQVFLDTFKQHGFPIERVRVERAGRLADVSGTAQQKAIIIYNYLKTGQFGRVRLFDDSVENLKKFLSLKRYFPKIEFQAFYAKDDGSVKTIKEEYGAGEEGTLELLNKYLNDTPYSRPKKKKKDEKINLEN